MASKTYPLSSLKRGGQFGAEKDGLFAAEWGGQFKTEKGGLFERIFQFIEQLVKQQFENAFTTDSGGTHILLDRQRIRRYSFTEIQTLFSR